MVRYLHILSHTPSCLRKYRCQYSDNDLLYRTKFKRVQESNPDEQRFLGAYANERLPQAGTPFRLERWNEIIEHIFQWSCAIELRDRRRWTLLSDQGRQQVGLRKKCLSSKICTRVKIWSTQPRSGRNPAWSTNAYLSRTLANGRGIMPTLNVHSKHKQTQTRSYYAHWACDISTVLRMEKRSAHI